MNICITGIVPRHLRLINEYIKPALILDVSQEDCSWGNRQTVSPWQTISPGIFWLSENDAKMCLGILWLRHG